MRRAVEKLPERERDVLELRFGLAGAATPLRETGQRLGLSAERVRQLEERALQRLSEEGELAALRDAAGRPQPVSPSPRHGRHGAGRGRPPAGVRHRRPAARRGRPPAGSPGRGHGRLRTDPSEPRRPGGQHGRLGRRARRSRTPARAPRLRSRRAARGRRAGWRGASRSWGRRAPAPPGRSSRSPRRTAAARCSPTAAWRPSCARATCAPSGSRTARGSTCRGTASRAADPRGGARRRVAGTARLTRPHRRPRRRRRGSSASAPTPARSAPRSSSARGPSTSSWGAWERGPRWSSSGARAAWWTDATIPLRCAGARPHRRRDAFAAGSSSEDRSSRWRPAPAP